MKSIFLIVTAIMILSAALLVTECPVNTEITSHSNYVSCTRGSVSGEARAIYKVNLVTDHEEMKEPCQIQHSR